MSPFTMSKSGAPIDDVATMQRVTASQIGCEALSKATERMIAKQASELGASVAATRIYLQHSANTISKANA